jgi:hypothetical protein
MGCGANGSGIGERSGFGQGRPDRGEQALWLLRLRGSRGLPMGMHDHECCLPEAGEALQQREGRRAGSSSQPGQMKERRSTRSRRMEMDNV